MILYVLVATIDDIVWEYRAGHTSRDAVEKISASLLGLSPTDARWWHLLQQSGPMTAGAIASSLGLTSGAVTAMIDRLERGAHVQRVRDLYKPFAARIRERLAQYSPRERELLYEFLRWDREQLDRHRARLERREARVRSEQQ